MDIVAQLFWFLSDRLSDFGRIVTPALLIASALAWFIRQRSRISMLGLLGAGLFAGSAICRYVVQEVRGTAFSYMVPAEGQNGFTYFIYVHAWWLGLATFSAATLVHFLRSSVTVKAKGRPE